MKTSLLVLFAAALLALPASRVHSQAAPPQNPAALLLLIKKNNDALLERQTATLQALEQMEQDAQEIRIRTKRG